MKKYIFLSFIIYVLYNILPIDSTSLPDYQNYLSPQSILASNNAFNGLWVHFANKRTGDDPVTAPTDEATLKIQQISELCRGIKTEIFLKYGFLDKDDPFTQYARNLFTNAFGKEAREYEIIVAPEWHEINAMALPDGTIILSGGLLKFAQYNEEILGVMAHEAIHIKKNHAKIISKLKQAGRINLKSILSIIGLKRLQEYQSDMSWMIEEFDNRKINPLGYRVFLERHHEFQEKSQIGYHADDLAHGGLESRAHNIDSVFHYMDFAALSHQLHKIPDTFKQDLKKVSEPKHINLWTNAHSAAEIEQIEKQRLEIIQNLPVESLSTALNVIFPLLNKHASPRQLKSNEKTITAILKRVENAFFPKSKYRSPRKRSLAIGLFLEFYAGINCFYAKECTSEKINIYTKNIADCLCDEKDFKLLLGILNDTHFQSLPTVAVTGSITKLTEDLFESFIQAQNLYKNPTRPNMKKTINFAANLAKACGKFFKQANSSEIDVNRTFYNMMRRIFIYNNANISLDNRKILNDYAEQTGLLTEDSSFTEINFNAQNISNMIYTRLFQKLKTGPKIKFVISDHKEITRAILKEIQDKDIYEMARFFSLIARFYVDGDIITPTDSHGFEKTDLPYNQKNYILFRLFEHVLTTNSKFKDLDPHIKHVLLIQALDSIVYGILHSLVIEKHTESEEIIVAGDQCKDLVRGLLCLDITEGQTKPDPQISETDVNYLQKLSHSIEPVLLNKAWTLKDIINFYTYLVKNPLFKEYTHEINTAMFNLILAKYLSQYTSWQEIFRYLELLEENGVPVYDIIAENTSSKERVFGIVFTKLWSDFPKKLNPKNLEQIRKVLNFVSDPFLKARLQALYYEHRWPSLSFDEKLDILFDKNTKGIFDINRFHEFTETQCHTKEQQHAARDRLKNEIDIFMQKSSWEAGVAAILSNTKLDAQKSYEFLNALLNTSEDDSQLKLFLYENIADNLLKDEGLDDSTNSEQEQILLIQKRILVCQYLENMIYRMGPIAKSILLRKLLTGKDGLISNPKNRRKFLTALLANSVQTHNDRQLMSTLYEVIDELVYIDAWKPIYFALSSLLIDKIAIPPQKPSEWYNLARISRSGLVASLSSIKFPNQTANEKPYRYASEFLNYSEEILKQKLMEHGAFETETIEKKALSPLSFVIELVQGIGALGVRFLQLLPQFADLPEKYLDEFVKVFDSVFGQALLAAAATLEREWPDMWDEIKEFQGREGGGSLMTVYKAINKKGLKEVLKVLNPNLEYHLDEVMILINQLLDRLVEKNPEKYTIVKFVVDDVVEWIKRDIHFENFLKNDEKFREKNNGYTYEGSKYKIYVPQSKGPENKRFMREEFIEGKNLTKWDELEKQGHNMADIVSLLTKNYVEQLESGVILVPSIHADAHIGNFKVTDDNRIAILDRNFYLEFNEHTKDFIGTFIGALKNPLLLLTLTPEILADKLIALAKNKKDITPAQREKIVQTVTQAIQGLKTSGDFKSISALLVSLRKIGLHIPLEITLILKNISALHEMAKKAGFANILQAYYYDGKTKIKKPKTKSHAQDTAPKESFFYPGDTIMFRSRLGNISAMFEDWGKLKIIIKFEDAREEEMYILDAIKSELRLTKRDRAQAQELCDLGIRPGTRLNIQGKDIIIIGIKDETIDKTGTDYIIGFKVYGTTTQSAYTFEDVKDLLKTAVEQAKSEKNTPSAKNKTTQVKPKVSKKRKIQQNA